MTLPIAPSQTLYIKNLNDKISVNELKRELYCLFSFVGPVVDIEARKSAKTRGQAWVSFISVEAATIAMQRLQGFNLLGKDMVISYSKSKSKTINDYIESLKKDEVVDNEDEDEEPAPKETATLRVDGYPPKINHTVLSILFRQINGFKKAELKENFTIVYYDNPQNAAEALAKFQGFKVAGDYRLSLTYYTVPEDGQ